MIRLVFAALFGLIFFLSLCKGQISLPPGGDTFDVLPGQNVTLAWKLNVRESNILARTWTFLPNSNSFAQIGTDGSVTKTSQYSPGPFSIKKPSTLILENVNIQYNGTYKFVVFATAQYSSFVTVIVEVKPTVTINCTDPLIVDEGNDFTCLCEAKGGNPPADVTWEKDGVSEPGGSGKAQKILTRINVSGADSGTYTCVAKGHTLMNNKSIDVKVRLNAKPDNTNITLTPKRANVGEKFIITCASSGVPEPKYNITHNSTEVSTEKTHIIPKVEWKHAGPYKCFVWNKLGSDSDSDILTVGGPTAQPATPTSKATTAKSCICNGTANTAANNEDGGKVVVWHIVVSLLSGVIIGFLLSYIVSRSRRGWFKNKKREPNPEAQATNVDTTYQELDLSKMNKEDHYQSLRVNAASNDVGNDDESTYTELNKARDVENNYQSLTQ